MIGQRNADQEKQTRRQTFLKVFQFNFKNWRADPGRLTLIVSGLVVATVFEAFVPYFSGRLVQAVTGAQGNVSAVWQQLLAVCAFSVGALVIRFLSLQRVIAFTVRQMGFVTSDVFHNVQHMSVDWHSSHVAGATSRAIARGRSAIDLFNDVLLTALLPTSVMLIAMVGVVGAFWWPAGLFVFLGSALYTFLTTWMSMSYVAPAASITNRLDSRLNGGMADAIAGNSVVKTFAGEERELGRLVGSHERWARMARISSGRGVLTASTQQAMMLVLKVGLIAAAVTVWQWGYADAGDVAFVMTAFFVLQGYMRDVGYQIRMLQRAVSDMEEMVEITRQSPEILDSIDALPLELKRGDINFSHVYFSYPGRSLIRDLNLHILPGERVGIVGASGSGKSTLSKLLVRLSDAHMGKIEIDGQDIAQISQSSLRRLVTVVQQEPILLHRSILDNIRYARPDASMSEVFSASRLAQIDNFISALPNGYHTVVGERGTKLSGGERQRVSLARAFLANAPIIVFDESTSSLDSVTEMLIQTGLTTYLRGKTAIVIAHRLSTVASLDRIVVMKDGAVIEEGTHSSLMGIAGGSYNSLVTSQIITT